MNVWPIVRHRHTRFDRFVDRQRTSELIGRLRDVRFWWLFAHMVKTATSLPSGFVRTGHSSKQDNRARNKI
jgi:hypothetical protein